MIYIYNYFSVRIYLYTYAILLSPADDYQNLPLQFSQDFDDLMGHQIKMTEIKYFSKTQARSDPESKKTGENKFSQYIPAEVKNRCS